eukprot:gene1194-1305_t
MEYGDLLISITSWRPSSHNSHPLSDIVQNLPLLENRFDSSKDSSCASIELAAKMLEEHLLDV